MADKQTEEDDDEGFVFGSFTSVPKTPTNLINGSDFFNQTKNDDDDDDWSDFVTFNQSPSPNLIRNPSNTSNSTQLTNSVTDQQVKLSAPEPDHSTESKPGQWIKIRGAIPLSIFGEEEEEEEEEKEESCAVDSSFNDKALFFKSDLLRKDSNTNKSVEISDLIKDLCGSKDNVNETKKDSSEQIGNGSVPKPNSNGTGFDLVNGDNQEVEGDGEDEWEWEFKGAYGERDCQAANSMLKEDESKSVNHMAFNFETSTSVNGFNSDAVCSKTNSAIMNFDTNDFKLNSAKEQDTEDYGWAFKGGGESDMKVETSTVKEDDSWDFKGTEVASSVKVGASKETENKAVNGFAFNFESLTMSWSGFNSDIVVSSTDSAAVKFENNGFDLNSAKEQDAEDDSWDFKGAEESHETSEVKEDDSWDFTGAEVVSDVEVEASKDLPESSKTSQMSHTAVFSNDMFGETNLFVSPEVNSHQIGSVGFSNGFTPSHASEDKIVSDILPIISPKVIKAESNSNLVSAAPLTPSHQEISERKQGNGRGALPLSIFGEEELKNDDSIIQSEVSTSVMANGVREGIKVTKALSFNYLISSLYSQSAQNASVNSIPGPSVHASNSAGMLTRENLADEDDDFNDSWDFKGDSTATSNESQTYSNFNQVPSNNVMVLAQPIAEPNIMNLDNSIDSSSWTFKDASLGTESRDFLESHQKLELDELWKFYSQLKDELHVVVVHHLDKMKKNNGLHGFVGEDAEVEVHNGELQDLYNEMYKENLISEIDSDGLSGRKIYLNGILEDLREKKFQVVEAEYQLSNRLSLAETDTGSLVEVLRHVSSVLRVLRLGSAEEHSHYISTWFKILCVCAKELKLGALIWKQAVDKKIHDQVLAESKGKKYILALGEIYRVVGILGSSAKVYKPWVLTDSINSSQICSLLDECSTSWLSSGLEEAVRSMSDPLEFHYEGTVKALLESIERVHNLEMPLLDNTNLAHSETLCQLSLLSPRSVPGMKMVSWNGKQYFLKLANLWANTVSCQPPDLPCIYVG